MTDELLMNATPRNLWRSVGAVVAGMLVVVVLSLVTDEMLHRTHVYPPWEHGLHDPSLNLLALSYRCLFNVVGGYVTALLAPRNVVRHLWIFALISFALGVVGAIATIPMNLGPAWYPILLALSAFPCTWVSWRLYRARA